MRSHDTSPGRPPHRKLGAVALAATLVLGACAGGGDDSDEVAYDTGDTADAAVDGGVPTRDGQAVGDDTTDGAGDGFDFGAVGRDVIVEMHITLSSDDIQRTVSSIMADATALGGGVASSDIRYPGATETPDAPADDGYAVLVVKIPPDRVARMLSGLDDTGTVLSIDQSAQDVTEQLVDLDVRITNARRSVATIRELMDEASDLTDLVMLEGELTRRQTELERLEAQQRNLGERVAFATLTIEVVPTASVPAPEPDDGIGDAFRTGWDAFLAFFFSLGFVLAVIAPFLGLGALLAALTWLILRRPRRTPPGDVTPDRAAAPDDELVSASHEE